MQFAPQSQEIKSRLYSRALRGGGKGLVAFLCPQHCTAAGSWRRFHTRLLQWVRGNVTDTKKVLG